MRGRKLICIFICLFVVVFFFLFPFSQVSFFNVILSQPCTSICVSYRNIEGHASSLSSFFPFYLIILSFLFYATLSYSSPRYLLFETSVINLDTRYQLKSRSSLAVFFFFFYLHRSTEFLAPEGWKGGRKYYSSRLNFLPVVYVNISSLGAPLSPHRATHFNLVAHV